MLTRFYANLAFFVGLSGPMGSLDETSHLCGEVMAGSGFLKTWMENSSSV